MALRARTKLACRIAGIDPLRVNEAVFAGHFPCAPQTQAGRARSFDVDEIVALRIFADKQRMGMSTATAGLLACDILAKMREAPEAGWITVVWGFDGGRAVMLGLFDEKAEFPWLPWKIYEERISVWRLRNHVLEELEAEANVLGAED